MCREKTVLLTLENMAQEARQMMILLDRGQKLGAACLGWVNGSAFPQLPHGGKRCRWALRRGKQAEAAGKLKRKCPGVHYLHLVFSASDKFSPHPCSCPFGTYREEGRWPTNAAQLCSPKLLYFSVAALIWLIALEWLWGFRCLFLSATNSAGIHQSSYWIMPPFHPWPSFLSSLAIHLSLPALILTPSCGEVQHLLDIILTLSPPVTSQQ